MSIFINNIEYKLIKRLNKGYYYSKVFQVEKDNKYYAIKEIKLERELKDKIKEIKKEAEILSKFNCKNIVKYYDSYLDKDKFYILMEYCDGQNLRDFINKHIKNNELIEEDILNNIIKQLCIGIKEIHEKNIIHRDLKPENIFINENNVIKIGDFGISKQIDPNKEIATTHFKAGSTWYMPPEIEIKGIYNKKSDMYSLGCIIYELFNLSKYYDDRAYNKIKKLDFNIYNYKWQEIINNLLQPEINNRIDINQVYDYIFKEIIIGEIYINKEDVNKNIQIINSFENIKREWNWKNKEDDLNYENEKEIKDNIEIKINGEIINFTYNYKFKKEGKYNFEYSFKNNLTKIDYMFAFCKTLTSLDLSNFNTKDVINMSYMFWNCKSLTSLNLSNCNTKNVITMRQMFSGCKSLTSLNLANFNTKNVTDMSSLFFNCEKLKEIKLQNCNTENVIDMSSMFSYCELLKDIDLSNFNTKKVINMSTMFSHCKSLLNLNLSNFDIQNVTHMIEMFCECKSLKKLNLSKFDTQNVINMNGMFNGCNLLKINSLITKDKKILYEFEN